MHKTRFSQSQTIGKHIISNTCFPQEIKQNTTLSEQFQNIIRIHDRSLSLQYMDTRIKGEVPGGSMSQVVGLSNNSYKPITNTAWVRARLCKLQKGALDSQRQVIKFTSFLPLVGGSLGVLRIFPPLKLVVMIQLKYC